MKASLVQVSIASLVPFESATLRFDRVFFGSRG